MQDTEIDPAEALALAARARRRAAERGQALWYHPVVGLSLAVMTAGLVLPSPIIGTTVGLAILGVNFALWRQRTGLGPIHHTGRTLRVAIPFAVAILAAYFGVFELWHRFGVEWAPLAGAPVLGALAALGSWMIDRAWLADQREA